MKINHIKKTFTLQQDHTDCGVACLLSLVRYHEGDISLEKLREISGTSRQGTTLLGLFQAANQIGLTAEGNQADIQALIEHKTPLILHVIVENNLQHYLVCYGYENGKFLIGDPAKGISYFSKEELENIWKSKMCLTLTPNADFVNEKTSKKAKRTHLINLIKDDYENLAISAILGIVISVVGMVLAVFSQKLIDHYIPEKNFQNLGIGLLSLFLLLSVRNGIIYIRQILLLIQAKEFNNRIIAYFYKTLLFLPKMFFDTREKGEFVARLNDTSRIQRLITQIIGDFTFDLIIVLTSSIFLFSYSWQAGSIALCSFPIWFYLIYSFNPKIISGQKRIMSAYAASESNYISTISGISEIKNFNRENFYSDKNKFVFAGFQNEMFSLGKLNAKLGLFAGISSVVFITLILSVTSFLTLTGKMQIGELTAILSISGSLIPSIGRLALVSIPLNEARVAFDRMFEFTRIKPEKEEPATISYLNMKSIDIENLSFRFPGRKQILKNISISVKKGEIIAVAGESGCGKTTLGAVLQKFYTPESGNIKINNSISLSEIETSVWRNIIASVPQEIHIFNGTVLENICFENTEHEARKVAEFLIKKGFAKFIDQFPHGLFTLVGESGINLSGGQKQIIALARALHKNPQFLILDESTSAMDIETENFTLDLLNSIKSETAVLFITHRFHILKNIADRIYIIENGEISICGNHYELMAQNNIYSRFWDQIIK